jgi:beta-phosphoglucomutase-like phosphatase (HAD superfamily)
VFPAAIFDFNGVLVDDELVHRDAFRDVLSPLGVSFTDDDYVERYLGFDDTGALRAMLADAGRTPSDREIDDLAQAKSPFTCRRAEASLVVSTAQRGRASVRRKDRSRSCRGAARRIDFALRRMDLDGVFGVIVSAEDTSRCKPDPMGYEICIEALASRIGSTSARRALVVEDSLAGIEAAKSAGLACLAVAHSYPEAQLQKAGADAVAPRIGAIDDEFVRAMYRRLESREHA